MTLIKRCITGKVEECMPTQIKTVQASKHSVIWISHPFPLRWNEWRRVDGSGMHEFTTSITWHGNLGKKHGEAFSGSGIHP